MIKGLAITPPVVGRISIGKVIERNGKRLPQKDDEFTLTTQVHRGDQWVLHPFDAQLRQTHGSANGKLRSIPVKLLFNAPDLNLRADYCLFDRKTGRLKCVGNGETCKRVTDEGVETLPCPSPDQCPLGLGACKPYGRFNVRIDAPSDTPNGQDELGSFVFRTTGYNSIRTLAARMSYLSAASKGHLATLPLQLQLRGKSTAQSHGTPIFYVDLTLRDDMTVPQAIRQASQEAEARAEAGFDQQALDEAARQGFANGLFEETAEDSQAVIEEFFNPDQAPSPEPTQRVEQASLAAKLESKAKAVAGGQEEES